MQPEEKKHKGKKRNTKKFKASSNLWCWKIKPMWKC